MPHVNIKFLEGRTLEQKRALVEKVTDALVETINCKREAVHIILEEITTENIATAGKLYCDDK